MIHSNRKQDNILLALIILPLIFGGGFYYYFSPNVQFVIYVDKVLKVSRHVADGVGNNLVIAFIRNNLLDMCWAVSFSSLISFVFLNDKKNYAMFFIPLIVGVMLELLQKVNILAGTFDVLDIVFELLGIILVVLILVLLSKSHGRTGGKASEEIR